MMDPKPKRGKEFAQAIYESTKESEKWNIDETFLNQIDQIICVNITEIEFILYPDE